MWFTLGILYVIISSKETKCFLIEKVLSFIRVTVRTINSLSFATQWIGKKEEKGKKNCKVFSAPIIILSVLLVLLAHS